MYSPDPTDIAPRAGFAWDVKGDGRWAVRGGYGLFYEVTLIDQTLGLRLNPPFFSGDLALGDGRTVTLANAFDNLAIVTPTTSPTGRRSRRTSGASSQQDHRDRSSSASV